MKDKELKRKWVAALRCGLYKQVTGVLQDGVGGYCCLGVLCDIEDGVVFWGDLIEYGIELGFYVNLNDYDRKSFIEIADIVEERE